MIYYLVWYNFLGVFSWGSGSKFTGHWKDGKQSGEGLFEWKHGDSYNGMWEDGKQNGFGKFNVCVE